MPAAYFAANGGFAFGPKTLDLAFKESFNRPTWKCEQKMELFFKRDGTSASSVAGVPTYVTAGNPNWYVYWPQIAGTFPGSGGTFGPQDPMEWSSDEYGEGGEWGLNTHSFPGGAGGPITAQITLYNICKTSAHKCIWIIHHENGHSHSVKLENAKGGWGPTRQYVKADDTDRDFIHDTFENAILDDEFAVDNNEEAVAQDKNERTAWDHAAYNAEAGRGMCTRNEAEVDAVEVQITAKDWSSPGPHKQF